MDEINIAIAPTPRLKPKSRSAFIEMVPSEAKPIPVVIDVKRHGKPTSLIASMIDVLLFFFMVRLI